MSPYNIIMEVVDTMGSEEGDAVVTTPIRLVVATEGGETTKYRKIESTGNEHITNIFVCNSRNYVSEDPATQNSSDMNLTCRNSSEKRNMAVKVIDMSNSVRISSASLPYQRKQNKGSAVITVINTKPSASAGIQLAKSVSALIPVRCKQEGSIELSSSPTSIQIAKTVPDIVSPTSKQGSSGEPIHIRLQNNADTVSKIIVASPRVKTKSQPIHNSSAAKASSLSDFHENAHCISLTEEHLPLLAEISGRSAHSASSAQNCQTVMMRVNNLGVLELDPMFLNTDALSELEVEEVSSCKSEELIVADEESLEFQSDKTQGENEGGNYLLSRLLGEEAFLKSSGLLKFVEEGGYLYEIQNGNANVNQNWFTSREDKEMFRWRGHAWRQGMWSKEETELLQKNIMEYCNDRNLSDPGSVIFKMSKEERSGFYRIIAKGLNRPLFSIYRRVIRLYDNRNHIGKYTAEEVSKLRELRMKHGNNWQAIAALLGRSAASVKDRCRLLNENCNRGAWTIEEEDRLAMAVYELASVFPGEQVTSGISWGEVAARVKTRSEKQCRTKWLNYLNWKRTSAVEWSKADDIQLICRLSVCGVEEESQVDWSVLARGWPACRSPHWLRGKWWNLKKRLPNSTDSCSLGEMCQMLYNMQSLNLLQSTLVELPTAGPTSTNTTGGPGSIEEKSSGSAEENLPAGTVKLCIPASNFANIINSDNHTDDFASKLSALVQTALVVPSGEVPSSQSVTSLVSQPNNYTSHSLSQLPSSLSTHLTSTLSVCSKSQSVVVDNLEDSMIHLSEVANDDDHNVLLEQDLSNVKEEDVLSDGEVANTQTSLSTSLDPSSPAVTSQVILNDPILSVSGEPLGQEEGLHQDHDDTDIVIV
ncbi:cyclin-D-binding Myb-like transcription factor 1 isoform X2 [Palaemon carinicauda]|uniref:cyclin-D-binding Myb-like transcription factor 1 isoform X2 n=1 Tax=Palaemon carinicauda TaxID=392227 RepID=UPI0035B5981F